MTNDTDTKIVTLKGVEWLVHRDGRVATRPHQSTYTRVRNGREQSVVTHRQGGFLSPCVSKSGYLEVAAMVNGKRVKALVHRLVGIAFVPGADEGLSINHLNGIKTDNRPENLEWVSLADNTKHQWRTGLVDLRGDKHPKRKLSSTQVRYMRKLLNAGVSANSLAIIAGVSPRLIGMIQAGTRWRDLKDE